MSSTLKWLLAFIISIIISIHLTFQLLPKILMQGALNRLIEPIGWNILVNHPPPSADLKLIVRPSPDLAYSLCGMKTNSGPLMFKMTFPEGTYSSLAIYKSNTDVLWSINDLETNSNKINVVIGSSVQIDSIKADYKIETDNKKLLAMARFLINTDSALTNINEARKSMQCNLAVNIQDNH